MDASSYAPFGMKTPTAPGNTFNMKCSSCDGAPACSWCIDCNDALCFACLSAHCRVKLTRSHQILKQPPAGAIITPPTKFCRFHPSEPLKLYCATCKELTCRDCQLMTHKNHRYLFINEALIGLKRKFEALVQPVRSFGDMMSQSLKDMDTRLQDITQSHEQLAMELENSYKILTQQIKTRMQELLTEAKTVADSERDSIRQRMVRIKQMQKDHQSACELAEAARNTNDLPQLLALFTQVQVRMKSFSNQDLSPPHRMSQMKIVSDRLVLDSVLKFGSLNVAWVPFLVEQSPDPNPKHTSEPQSGSSQLSTSTSSPLSASLPLFSSVSPSVLALLPPPKTSGTMSTNQRQVVQQNINPGPVGTSVVLQPVTQPSSILQLVQLNKQPTPPQIQSTLQELIKNQAVYQMPCLQVPLLLNQSAPPSAPILTWSKSKKPLEQLNPKTFALLTTTGNQIPVGSEQSERFNLKPECRPPPPYPKTQIPTHPNHQQPDQRPADQRLTDQRLPDQRPAEQRQLDLRPADQQLRPDCRPADQRQLDQRQLDQRQLDQRLPDQRLPDQRLPDHRLPDQRLPDQRLLDQRPAEQRQLDLRPADQQLRPDCRLADQRQLDQRPADQRLPDQRPAEQRQIDLRPADQQLRPDCSPADQRQLDQRLADQRPADEQLWKDQRPEPDHRLADQRIVNQQLVPDPTLADQRPRPDHTLAEYHPSPIPQEQPDQKPEPVHIQTQDHQSYVDGGSADPQEQSPSSADHLSPRQKEFIKRHPILTNELLQTEKPDHQLTCRPTETQPSPDSELSPKPPPLPASRHTKGPRGFKPSLSQRLISDFLPPSSVKPHQVSPVVRAVADSACDSSVQQVVLRQQEPSENEPTSTVTEEPEPEENPTPEEPESDTEKLTPPDSKLNQCQPIVSLYRLPLGPTHQGSPLMGFRLVQGEAEDEIYVEEMSEDSEDEDPVEQPSPPESPLTLRLVRCSACGSANGSMICSACGRGFHRECHLPPVGCDIWREWICSLCQDLSDPTDPYSSTRPPRPQGPCLSGLEQRKCEKLLLCLKVEGCGRLSQLSGIWSRLKIMSESLSLHRSPVYVTSAKVLYDIWRLFKDAIQEDHNLNYLQDRFQDKVKETFNSPSPPSDEYTHPLTPSEWSEGEEVEEVKEEEEEEEVKVVAVEEVKEECKLNRMRKRLREFIDLTAAKRRKVEHVTPPTVLSDDQDR